MDQRIEEGFRPYLYEEDTQVSLSEILQARRRGKTASSNSGDLKNQQQGVTNQGADDRKDSGQSCRPT